MFHTVPVSRDHVKKIKNSLKKSHFNTLCSKQAHTDQSWITTAGLGHTLVVAPFQCTNYNCTTHTDRNDMIVYMYLPLRLAAVGQYQQISCFARQRWTDRFGSLPAVSFASLPREHHLPFCDTRASSVGMYIRTYMCMCMVCVSTSNTHTCTCTHAHYINHRQIDALFMYVHVGFYSAPPDPNVTLLLAQILLS